MMECPLTKIRCYKLRNMKNKILNLEKILKIKENRVLDCLLEPERLEDLIDLLNQYKIPLLQELLDLFMWKNGIDSALLFSEEGYKFELTSFGNFFELRGLLSHHFLEIKTKNIPYDNKYFAIFFTASGDRILVDIDSKSNTYSRLFIYAPSVTLSYEPMQIFDSLELMLDTIIECYEKGAYSVLDGILNVDYDLESSIAKRININSEFWN